MIERAVITADGVRLAIELPDGPAVTPGKPSTWPVPVAEARVLTDDEVRRLESDNIRAGLRRTAG